jgi:hypothetical protein
MVTIFAPRLSLDPPPIFLPSAEGKVDGLTITGKGNLKTIVTDLHKSFFLPLLWWLSPTKPYGRCLAQANLPYHHRAVGILEGLADQEIAAVGTREQFEHQAEEYQ